MAACIYIAVASATILAVGASSLTKLQVPPSTKAFPEIRIDSYNSTEKNETYRGWGISQYLYLDFPKIGLTIFKKKMLDAFKTLNRFMQMKPAYLKISQYFLHKGTKNDSVCLVCAGITDGEALRSEEGSVTESPENAGPDHPRASESAKVLHEIEPQLDPAEGSEVKLTKVEPEGFFSKSLSAAGGFLTNIGSWVEDTFETVSLTLS